MEKEEMTQTQTRTTTIYTGATGSAPYQVIGTVYPERRQVEVASQIPTLREAKRIAAAWKHERTET